MTERHPSERLRELRKAHGLTQEGLAALLNTTATTIMRIETRRVQPTLDSAAGIERWSCQIAPDDPIRAAEWATADPAPEPAGGDCGAGEAV